MPKWDDWNIAYTKKGKAHMMRTRALRLLALAMAIVGMYRARQNGVTARDAKATIANVLLKAFATVVQVGTSLKNHAVAAVSR
jgi:hypothetical protein